jgi:hypothetical protein
MFLHAGCVVFSNSGVVTFGETENEFRMPATLNAAMVTALAEVI